MVFTNINTTSLLGICSFTLLIWEILTNKFIRYIQYSLDLHLRCDRYWPVYRRLCRGRIEALALRSGLLRPEVVVLRSGLLRLGAWTLRLRSQWPRLQSQRDPGWGEPGGGGEGEGRGGGVAGEGGVASPGLGFPMIVKFEISYCQNTKKHNFYTFRVFLIVKGW